eukprot:403350516
MVFYSKLDDSSVSSVDETMKKSIEIQRENSEQIIFNGLKYISMAMGTQTIHGLLSEQDYGGLSLQYRVVTPLIMCLTSLMIRIIISKFPQFSKPLPFLLNYIGMFLLTERHIAEYPQEFKISDTLMLLQTVCMWVYYILRNYIHYNYFSFDFMFSIIVLIALSDLTAQTHENLLKTIKNLQKVKENEMRDGFKNALDIIPQGILLFNHEKGESIQKLIYANDESKLIFHTQSCQLDQIMDFIGLFKLKNQIKNNKTPPTSHLAQQQNDKILSPGSLNSINFKNLKMHNSMRNIEINLESGNLLQQDLQWNMSLTDFLAYMSRNPFQVNQNIDYLFKKHSKKLSETSSSQYILVRSCMVENGQNLMTTINDITKLKTLEKTAKRLKGLFFSSIAHELRTPLNSIIPVSKELIKQEGINEKTKFLIEIIINSAHHLENVVEDALDLNRIENNKFEINYQLFNVREVVDEVKNIMKLQIEQRGVKLLTEVTESVPTQIVCDKKRYKQILFNLIDFEDRKLKTKVIDTGVGIKPDDIVKLFRFFGKLQDKKNINSGGMGLGLTISKMLVSQMQGNIKVHSEVNKGSEFSFEIPINDFTYQTQKNIVFEREQEHSNKMEGINLQYNAQNCHLLNPAILLQNRANQNSFSSLQYQLDNLEQEESQQDNKFKNFTQSYFLNYNICNLKAIDRDSQLFLQPQSLVFSEQIIRQQTSLEDIKPDNIKSQDQPYQHHTNINDQLLLKGQEKSPMTYLESGRSFQEAKGVEYETKQQQHRAQNIYPDEELLIDDDDIEEEKQPSQLFIQTNMVLTASHRGKIQHEQQQEPNPEVINFQQQIQSNNQPLKVLIADDQIYNLFIMKELLLQIPKIDKDIKTALNGQIAFDMIMDEKYRLAGSEELKDQKFTPPISIFNLLFLDMNMPVLDGLELTIKLRDQERRGLIDLSNTKIIAFSAITRDQFEHTKHQELFDEFLEKPISIEKLKELIDRFN